jgi:hypothetical protein
MRRRFCDGHRTDGTDTELTSHCKLWIDLKTYSVTEFQESHLSTYSLCQTTNPRNLRTTTGQSEGTMKKYLSVISHRNINLNWKNTPFSLVSQSDEKFWMHFAPMRDSLFGSATRQSTCAFVPTDVPLQYTQLMRPSTRKENDSPALTCGIRHSSFPNSNVKAQQLSHNYKITCPSQDRFRTGPGSPTHAACTNCQPTTRNKVFSQKTINYWSDQEIWWC